MRRSLLDGRLLMSSCETCCFFMPRENADGLCRRFPPVALIHEDGPVISVFPPMLPSGWCGEHIPTPESGDQP